MSVAIWELYDRLRTARFPKLLLGGKPIEGELEWRKTLAAGLDAGDRRRILEQLQHHEHGRRPRWLDRQDVRW